MAVGDPEMRVTQLWLVCVTNRRERQSVTGRRLSSAESSGSPEGRHRDATRHRGEKMLEVRARWRAAAATPSFEGRAWVRSCGPARRARVRLPCKSGDETLAPVRLDASGPTVILALATSRTARASSSSTTTRATTARFASRAGSSRVRKLRERRGCTARARSRARCSRRG